MKNDTVIKIKKPVREGLKKIGKKGQSYSDIIESFMDSMDGEEGILKLFKDCEGKLSIEVLYPRNMEINAFSVSKELENAIIKELKEHGFGGALDVIESCNRWDSGYNEIAKRWYKDVSKKLAKYEASEVIMEKVFDEMEDIIEQIVEDLEENPDIYEKEFKKAFEYVIKKLNIVLRRKSK